MIVVLGLVAVFILCGSYGGESRLERERRGSGTASRERQDIGEYIRSGLSGPGMPSLEIAGTDRERDWLI